MNPTPLLYFAVKALGDASKGILSEQQLTKVQDTIMGCSVAAAIAGVGSGWLPGAGALVASAAWVAAIWTMYVKINKDLGISIKDNVLKSLASAFLTNIIASAGALILGWAASLLLSLLPGFGTAGAVVIDGMIGYVTVFASGVLYINLLTKVMKAKGRLEFADGDDLKQMAKDIVKEGNVKGIMKEARKSYKEAKANGEFDKK